MIVISILQITYLEFNELNNLSKAQIQDLNLDQSDYKSHMLSNTSCSSPLLMDSKTLRFRHAFQGSFEVGIKSIFCKPYGKLSGYYRL